MKILLVDDCANTRRGLLRLLEDNGHEVVTANNKDGGLGFLKFWHPELIIIGLWKNAISDSLELIKNSKHGHLQAKFWLLWSDADWKIISLAKESGAERIISKADLIQAFRDELIIK